ncbi:hypothetical protein [Nocardioides sp. CER19]|uniref:hypothetical protein n=1 Tax=Nocardioides sp. CER19 TaxID=3038538 RepID=UPI0024471A82|nr:hypothetical protein [Nocardioides sp. CER19]MDH2416492.1 hypothetical protein [Nocardioides sp. CER19]
MEDVMTTEACTLPTAERPLRLAEFDALFASSARSVVRRDLEVQIHLTGAEGLLESARDLAERETACCSFFTFAVEGTDDDFTMSISAPRERRDILDALATRAKEGSA